MEIVYNTLTATPSANEQAFIDLLVGASHTVTVVADGGVVATNYSAVDLLIIRAPGDDYTAHPESNLNALDVPIICMSRYTSRFDLGMSSNSGASSAANFTRVVLHPIGEGLTSPAFVQNSTAGQGLWDLAAGVDLLWHGTASDRAGIAIRESDMRIHWSAHRGSSLTALGESMFLSMIDYVEQYATLLARQRTWSVSTRGTEDDSPYSEDFSFILLTSAPLESPVLSQGDTTDTTINLSWTSVPDAAEYELYRDSVLIYDGPDRSFQDIGLTASTTYTYTVLAKNSIGDGPLSAPYDFSTAMPLGLAPTLLLPAVGAKTLGEFTWEFNTQNAVAQEAFAFRRTLNNVHNWWTGSSWSASETFITSSAESLTIPSSDLLNTGTNEWTVRTREVGNDPGPYATAQAFLPPSEALVPTLVSPADLSESPGTSFSWEFNTDNTVAQEAFAFKAEVISTNTIETIEAIFTGHRGRDWAGDGSLIAYGRGSAVDHCFSVYRAPNWVEEPGGVAAFSTTAQPRFSSVAVNHDGTLVCTGWSGESQTFIVWQFDNPGWSVAFEMADANVDAYNVWFSNNGQYLFIHEVEISVHTLTYYDVSDWTTRNTGMDGWGLNDFVSETGMVFSHDNLYFLRSRYNTTTDYEAKIHTMSDFLVDLDLGSTIAVDDAAFSPDNQYLAIANILEPPVIRLYEYGTWNEILPLLCDLNLHLSRRGYRVSWSSDSKYFFIRTAPLSSNNRLSVFDVSQNFAFVLNIVRIDGSSEVSFLRFDAKNINGIVYIWVSYTTSAGFDNEYIYSIGPDSDVYWWDGTDWSVAEVYLEDGAQTVSIPAAKWGDITT